MCFKIKQQIRVSRWLLAIWCLIFCIAATAQNHKSEYLDSINNIRTIDVNIFNRYDDFLIDTTYMGNSEVFLMLDSLIQDTIIINHTKTINVITSSSIEGTVLYNTILSQRRMHTIEAIFRSRYNYIADDIWNFDYTPENWTHLRNAVVMDTNLPNQEGVLSIIDMEERHPDAREHLLKTLDNGTPWSYIHKHILPASRGSVSMLFVPTLLAPITTPKSVTSARHAETPFAEMPTLNLPTPTYSRPIMSIRSNLLLDLSSTINIGVEIPFSPHWSISAEYIHPWWQSWDNALTWQIQSLYFDLRYWLGYRGAYNYLTGWSIGGYAGSGWYDLQPFSNDGVQGEYTDFGATLSYAHYLGKSKHWLMEYTVGLGYVTTHYRNYYTANNTEEYGNIKVHHYPWSEEILRAALPTRLGVTLAYLITIHGLKRRGGVQ